MKRLSLISALVVLSACSGPVGDALNDPEAYVLRLFADHGCEMSYDAFSDAVDADGFDAEWPRRGEPDEETRQRIEAREEIYLAVATLLEREILVVDESDRDIVRSRGAGCR